LRASQGSSEEEEEGRNEEQRDAARKGYLAGLIEQVLAP
jgi:hypothetical protein